MNSDSILYEKKRKIFARNALNRFCKKACPRRVEYHGMSLWNMLEYQ